MKNYYSCERENQKGNLIVLEAERIARKTTKETRGKRVFKVTLTAYTGRMETIRGYPKHKDCPQKEMIMQFSSDEFSEIVEGRFYRILRDNLNDQSFLI